MTQKKIKNKVPLAREGRSFRFSVRAQTSLRGLGCGCKGQGPGETWETGSANYRNLGEKGVGGATLVSRVRWTNSKVRSPRTAANKCRILILQKLYICRYLTTQNICKPLSETVPWARELLVKI